MKAPDRHDFRPVNSRVMISDDQENRVLPIVGLAGCFKEFTQRIVGILYGIIDRIFFSILQGDSVIRKLKRGVIGRGEHQAEKWFFSGLAEFFMGPVEQVFVRDTP